MTIIELLARRAGLDKALAEFPEDVAAAAEQGRGAPGWTRRWRNSLRTSPPPLSRRAALWRR